MKLGLFIPTYNVESRVGSVLADLARGPVDRFSKIYVIDNGSGDRSREVVAQTLRDFPTLGQRTELWQNRRNYLLGGSTLLAIEKALGDGLDYLLNLHSDGQAKVADLEGMINRCRVQGPLVLGSRLLRDSKNEEYERVRLWGNLAFSRWQRWITNSSARDLGALMALPLRFFPNPAVTSVPTDMSFQPLMLMRLIQHHPDLEIVEVPISWDKAEITNINPWIYGIHHCFRLIRFSRLRAAGMPVMETDLVWPDSTF